MAETTTIARPYARAAFEYAQSGGAGFQQWSQMLELAAAVVADPAMRHLLASPQLNDERKVELLLEVCGDRLDSAGQNFIRLLAEHDRLPLLPDIASIYEKLRAEAERTLEAELISAMPVNKAQQKKIAQALSTRLKRKVTLKYSTDPSLLGGAIIRAGDLVIDGSARGRLSGMATALRQ